MVIRDSDISVARVLVLLQLIIVSVLLKGCIYEELYIWGRWSWRNDALRTSNRQLLLAHPSLKVVAALSCQNPHELLVQLLHLHLIGMLLLIYFNVDAWFIHLHYCVPIEYQIYHIWNWTPSEDIYENDMIYVLKPTIRV